MKWADLRDDWHRLAPGVMCRFEFIGGELNCRWAGRPPSRAVMQRILPQYRAARDQFLLAALPGAAVTVLELPL